MKKIILALPFLLSQNLLAQSSMDSYRWYLNPQGQEVRVSIDDLNDEVLSASPSMDWGRHVVPGLRLKKDITIAVIDGGIDIEHPELKDHIAYNEAECFEGTTIPPKDGEDKDKNNYKGDCAGWDFVENSNRPEDLDGHGTHVTGVIASVLSGLEGNFKFLPLKVFAPNEGRQSVAGSTPLYQRLTKAFEYALLRKVDVVHLSVGWPKSYITVELDQMIKKVIDSGIIVVAAAGNSSQRATIYPCQMEGVICVGALRPNGEVARFSNWGMQVDIYAPGERIMSTIPYSLNSTQISRKGYDYKNGTSQAAPFISAAMGLLRGVYPQESKDLLFARLMKSSDQIAKGKGLKGLFHLDRALKTAPATFVFPVVKGLTSVVINQQGEFKFSLPVKNFGSQKSASLPASMTCAEALVKTSSNISSLTPGSKLELSVTGSLKHSANEINCDLQLGSEKVSLRLKVLKKLKASIKEGIAPQEEKYVVRTRSGGRTRLQTLTTLKGQKANGFYYVTGAKEPAIYFEESFLGNLKMSKGCNLLRLWQIDVNKDSVTDIMLESLCDDKHLSYRFFNNKLQEISSEVKYRPALTIVNYEDFDIILQVDTPPVFRFINNGLSIPSEDPWEEADTGRSIHLYELFPVKRDGVWKFDIRLLENPKLWQASLGLRFMPEYQVLHQLGERLLVRIGQKYAWVELSTQKASWAKLEQFLLEGTRKQKLMNSQQDILQGFLTPYEYRGILLNGVSFSYSQKDKFDPLIDVLSTTQNSLGYLTILQSFQRLIYLQYSDKGDFLSRTDSVVDRFDFLTTQDLLASVVNLETDGGSIQIVDGTKLNTNYVDVLKAGKLESFEIPSECVTQQPVIVEGRPSLPVFCPLADKEFTMKFIGL